MFNSTRNYSRQPRVSPSTSSGVKRRHRPDYLILIISLLLSVIGLVVVYSIGPALAVTENVSNTYFVSKQLIAVGLGLLAFGFFSMVSLQFLRDIRKGLLIASAIAVIALMIFGDNVNGATRWIQIGGLSFQVAEFLKLTLIIWLGAFLLEQSKKAELASKNTMKVLLIILGIIGVVVAGITSDLGSAAVMGAILAVMVFNAGVPMKPLMILFGVILVGGLLFISTSDYRRQRVETFLNPQADCQGAGYQACQSLIAIGNGGMFGRGLGQGVGAYGYIPEAANDSIFAISAEKFGFIGVSILISIYLALFYRLKLIIERTEDSFARLFVIGVLAWLGFQTIINVGAMVGLLPLKGITLPFVSYGGTSIVFVMAALGVVFHISRYTNFEPIRSQTGKGIKDENRSVGGRVRRPYYASTSRRA